MTNANLVDHLFQCLHQLNVSEVVVCAGARNFPIVHHLEGQSFKVISYFEERSASFYALGRIRATHRPVAVVVTSGTAVSELYSAVIESYYQGLPLIVITADRPKSYRGSGAPQAIQQANLFQSYVSDCLDWDIHTTNFTVQYNSQQPLHFNICFDEPLLDEKTNQSSPIQIQNLENKLANWHSDLAIKNPLVILSDIPTQHRQSVQSWVEKNNLCVYPEFLSGISGAGLNCIHEAEIDQYIQNNQIQSIVRIGGIPTVRMWRDLEGKYKHLPVYHFSQRPFSGLSQQREVYPIETLFNVSVDSALPLIHSAEKFNQLKAILKKYPKSEQSWMAYLRQNILNQNVYIGNSLPIRIWDFVTGVCHSSHLNPYANRGANGIDGQVSTYLGWAQDLSESWCVLGDLTTLYDLAALGLATHFDSQCRIVIMNNSGGQIFNRIFGNEKYLNPQNVQFKYWAQMWGWDYLAVHQPEDLDHIKNRNPKKVIVEIFIDKNQTQSVWMDSDQLWKK